MTSSIQQGIIAQIYQYLLTINYDENVLGAGPARQSLACALSNCGLKIALIEKQFESTIAEPGYDGREIALTHLPIIILDKRGVWDSKMAEHAISYG